MKKGIQKAWKNFKKEIASHKLIYFLLFFFLLFSFLLRVYRVGQVLGFYFDQGRDALVIWDLWHNGKFFLVGPTTGIAGIFRGPFYYYLIAPFYLIGGGDPIWPSVFLALTSVLALVLVYHLGFKFHSRMAGLLGVIIAGCSFYIVMAARWLSNPTPMLLLSVLLIWLMDLANKGKKWVWPGMGLIAGLSLFHFGSAGEVFYFPAIFIFFVWQLFKNKFNFQKTIGWPMFFLSGIALFLTAAPLILFDLRHQGILRDNIQKFLVQDQSFKLDFWSVFQTRINFYYDVFTNKIFHGRYLRERIILGVIAGSFLISLPRLWKKDGIKILLLLQLSPLVGLLFFQGNFGNIYDYYLTGYYLIFILLFSIVLSEIWQLLPGKVFVLFFFYLFFLSNLEVLRYKLSDGLDGFGTVAFGNEKKAIDWIYQDAQGQPFNVDVYVPPVIPYAYDYLFLWYGPQEYGYPPLKEEQIPLLYTLLEDDEPHPERRDAWLERQAGIGEIEQEERFGGIVVQRRSRLE